jgi:hypothetical protein
MVHSYGITLPVKSDNFDRDCMFVHHSIKTPKCYDVTISIIFCKENAYESLLYQPPVDKLRKTDTETPLIMFLITAAVNGRFDA